MPAECIRGRTTKMPKPTKKTLLGKAKKAVVFGHNCANGKCGGKEYRTNAAMCYNLCLQIIGDEAHFGGPARELVLKTFEVRDKEVNPEVK